jgi:DNA-binding MarR family transcriptional regulator
VRRVNDPDDRRCIRAELTAAGRERQIAGADQLRKVQDRFETSLPGGDLSALMHVLATL